MTVTMSEQEAVRMGIGEQLINALSWRGAEVNFDSILRSDKETKDILIKEDDLMELIQKVTPCQKTRRIRLV